jgi:hypothetical protein
MTIFKKHIPRRTFLRSAGAAVALPLLDSMFPALAGPGDMAARSVTRLSFVYLPNGVIMQAFRPATEGTKFETTRILEPLAPFRDRYLVLSGLDQKEGLAKPGEGGQDHSRASGSYLTGVHPKHTGGVDFQLGISVDQVAAKELGKKTQLASLEMSLESSEHVSSCEGLNCAYMNTISWRTATTPMPMEDQPRTVFERLFGDTDTTDSKQRLARVKQNRSLLDSLTAEASRFGSSLGPRDKAKIAEYLDAIRDVERRIQVAEEQASRQIPVLERPVGVPSTFMDYAKLMYDLQVLAYQSDLTRVITFMVGKEQSNRTYPEIGVPDAHHSLSHHRGDPTLIEQLTQINVHHMKAFAYFLEKLKATQDGDGSLLDHSMILYGAALSDGNLHQHVDLSVLLVGGGAGKLNGGRHIRYPKDTPMTNLYLTMLDKLGIPLDHLGDSNGELNLLPVA